MASAKKKEHLEAGKKKLEEFRRKKAAEKAEKAKKGTSTSQTQASTGAPNEKQASETGREGLPDSNGIGVSDDIVETPSVFTKNETKESNGSYINNFSSSSDTNAKTSFSPNDNDASSSVFQHSYLNGEEYKNDDASVGSAEPKTIDYTPHNRKDGVSFAHLQLDDYPSNKSDGAENELLPTQKSPVRDLNHSSPWTSNIKFGDYNSDTRISSNYAPPSSPLSGRRSRPSFLDSINISKGSFSSSSPPLFGVAKADSSSSKVYPMDILGSSVSQKSATSAFPSGDGDDSFMENKLDFFSRNQNEDFSALEQHIEDLTQEKFSLQRALESSRALTESLASENSTLTDSFNQQGGVVNQLKFTLEELQEEIKAQLAELEAVKMEYSNAQLECNAADERAKLLASEVIGLEEKALRLRSNELKLERQLEISQAEIASYRKKMSSLEKDHQDLQSTIDALQEEKKLLQAKLLKASASGKSVTSHNKKDGSTSTEDLERDSDVGPTMEASTSDDFDTVSSRDDAYSSPFPHENIPSDQIRVIQNINTLIAELALEKDQLTQALSAESQQSSKLLVQNKELTRKLESQTQKFELLMSRSSANGNILLRHQDLRAAEEITKYADEGDEVVERVLGWVMKLFPGGPSRRRSSL